MAMSMRSLASLSKNLRKNYLIVAPQRLASTRSKLDDVLNSLPETRITTLSNGLRVATEDLGLNTSTVGLYINAGSRHESEKTNGTGNFLEHMLYRGTKKRSKNDLESELESLGGQLNGEVGREHTAVYARTQSKDVARAVDLLADITLNPALDDKEVELVRTQILQEMEDANKDLAQVTMDYLYAAGFQGTPMARSPVGTTANVKSIKSSDLQNYHGTTYLPSRMVLIGTGGVNHDELVKLAEKHFGSAKSSPKAQPPNVQPVRFSGAQLLARDDDIHLAHVAIAIEGADTNSDDAIPLMVASTLIGNYDRAHGSQGMTGSFLAQRSLAEHLAHSFNSFNHFHSNTGLFGCYFVTDRMKIDYFMGALQTRWMTMCTSATEFEVDRAKNILKTSLLTQLEDGTNRLRRIGKQILAFNKTRSLAELDSRIDAVSANVIKAVGDKYLYDKCPAVSGVGPTEQVPDYNITRGRQWWLRR